MTAQNNGTATWALVSLVAWLASRIYLMEFDYPKPLGYSIALLTLVPFLVFLFRFFKAVRSVDELERQVQLEALALAFPLTVLGLLLLSLLQMVAPLNAENWSYRHLLPMVFIAYLFGLMLAKRRYGLSETAAEND
ncbi:MAG: hypothetical protein IPN76_29260 [Saprospiraceae bacterium]|nr:hypothetical protein [Saprospiraceae bacterium]